MKQTYKAVALWMLIFLVIIGLFNALNEGPKKSNNIQFSQFIQYVKEGRVNDVTFKMDNTIIGKYIEGKNPEEGILQFQTIGDTTNERWTSVLEAHNITPNYEQADKTPFWQSLLISSVPVLILVGLFFLFMRQLQAGGGKAMSFGKSKARLLNEDTKKVTFKDVAGIEEAKDELQEIVYFLKDPKKFTKLGGRIPKGVLLMGPPGTGKTLLARAIAGEAGVPFFTISGSDFVEMFVGVGASRVRDLFEQGKKHAPCIIFIDEIDAVGRHRGAGLGGGHDEREQTLNQLLVEMDGFESNEGVILIAATNRPDVLDPAILRPGRFDRRVTVPTPDLKGREAIIGVHTKKTPLSDDVDISIIARGTPGFSGADLENLVNEAALIAARKEKNSVEMADFEEAKDKVLMGSERRSLVMSDEDKKNTAYHESGHTMVGKVLNTDPIHKVTIIPRGRALGVTQTLPVEDRVSMDKDQIENNIAFLMGGRAAEELIFNKKTTGAGNDIERATEIARKMVCEWGMSDVLGPMNLGHREEPVFLGKDISQSRDFSEQTAQTIDREIRSIVDRNYKRAVQILTERIEILHTMSHALLEWETLNSKQVDILMEGKQLSAAPKSDKNKDDADGVLAAREGEENLSVKNQEQKKSGSEGGSNPAPVPA